MSARGRGGQVKNKAPAPVQITAEQLIREAMERVEAEPKAPKQKITDPQELAEFRLQKRKKFEDTLRKQRSNVNAWCKYALWEASQKEFDRARSVFERALEHDYRNQTLWLKYAEMEMKNKFINSARNVWDRAVTLLPRVDQFWYKYAYMEEMLGNVGGARQIFERWMQWMPDHNAWNSYVKLEVRHDNSDRARDIFERWLKCIPEARTYMKYAKFEERLGQRDRARGVYERALEEIKSDHIDEELFIDFAKFEEKCKEYERARVIYKYALDNLPKGKAQELYQTYTAFEKQFGSTAGVEEVILSKRRFQYEEEIKANPKNYDIWFDYIRLEEGNGDKEKIREVYERAIANVPPSQEKRYWKRYIYLWINFALYEELIAQDYERTRGVYTECLNIIPHNVFTFSKVWLMFAKFEIRRKNVDAARKILGTAIGKCPKDKIFTGYIELEMQLGEMDRCRKLYEKFLETRPENVQAWTKFAELESTLQEVERARAIFELAVDQPLLDMPELLWKAYIDFETKLGEHERTRALYERLLSRTKHFKVWMSRAQFEASIGQIQRARQAFDEAEKYFKEQDNAQEERLMILEGWREMESKQGTPQTLSTITAKLPQRIKKKRLIRTEDGEEAGWEEYFEYIFPGEQKQNAALALLQRARQWKKQKQTDTNDDEPNTNDETNNVNDHA